MHELLRFPKRREKTTIMEKNSYQRPNKHKMILPFLPTETSSFLSLSSSSFLTRSQRIFRNINRSQLGNCTRSFLMHVMHIISAIKKWEEMIQSGAFFPSFYST